jgi:hypothetical protein
MFLVSSSLKKFVKNLPTAPKVIEVTIIALISNAVKMFLRLSNCHSPPIASTEDTARRVSPIFLHFFGVGFLLK